MSLTESQFAPQIQSQQTAPEAQAPPEPQSQYGPNNETLPKELADELRSLVQRLRDENRFARRQEIQKIMQARLFWKGQQYAWWSEKDSTWNLPTEKRPADDEEEDQLPAFQFVTNIYQGFGLNFISVIVNLPIKTKLWPQSVEQQQDVATAKEGQKVIDLFHRNNRMELKRFEAAFYLWTDAGCGGYVRYVSDKTKYGTAKIPVMTQEMARLGEDKYVCPFCETETPVNQVQWMMCPQCMEPLGPENVVPAQLTDVPRISGSEEYPNGQEVLDMIPFLELERPLWCVEQSEFPFLAWDTELHEATLKAAYPHKTKELGKNFTSTGGGRGEESYDRTARLRLKQGGGALYGYGHRGGGDYSESLITLSRIWLRPSAFVLCEKEEIKKQLQKLFSEGCYVAFAGDTYCESRNEKMDDKWRMLDALPGEGQAREAVGSSIVPVQEQLNDLTNMEFETYQYGVPTTYYDPAMLDREALKEQSSLPGNHVPINRRPGEPASNSFAQTETARVSDTMLKYRTDLFGPIPQFLSGLQPAVYGQEIGKTAAEYRMAIEQAMGRIGLLWIKMKHFYSQLDLLGVECFRTNRQQDVEIPLFGEGKDFTSDWIRLHSLQGHLVAYPEVDTAFPMTQAQQRGLLFEMLLNPAPALQLLFSSPENMDTLTRLTGFADFKVPGEDSRIKQYKEIEQLLKERPQPSGDINPETGMPVLLPSVVPDQFSDTHEMELMVCKWWLNSAAGQTAKAQNPMGHENVKLHGMAHEQILKMTQLREAVATSGVARLDPPVPTDKDLPAQDPSTPGEGEPDGSNVSGNSL